MSIIKLAEHYNQFQHDFGQDAKHDYEQIMLGLFTPTLKKIANGQKLVGNLQQLHAQLQGVKDIAGSWVIQSLDVIPSYDQTKCTNHYVLSSEKAGNFEVIAILSAPYGLIELIHEVYYQI